jgi:uncharacterized membrane-anchored protein
MTFSKKALKTLSAVCMCGALLVGGAAPAAAETVDPDGLVLYVGQDRMINGGDSVSLEDSAPVLQQGKVYVPLRAVAEGFGADVDYDHATGDITVSQDDHQVVLNLNASIYAVDGSLKWMDVAPYVNDNERVMVPVRVITDGLGYDIDVVAASNGRVEALYINHAEDED